MKKLYIWAWIALAAAVVVSGFTGTLDVEALLVYSLIALALFYSLALWTAVVNSPGLDPGWAPEGSGSNESKEVNLQ